MAGTNEPPAPAPALASLRERKKRRTRAALVAAALDLFERRGYDATTIDDIAAAADVSPRTYFRYFATKEEVAQGDDVNASIYAMIASRPADEPVIESVRFVATEGFALLSDFDRAALLSRLRLIHRTPSLLARRMERFREMAVTTGAMLAERHGLPADDLGSRVTAAAALSAIQVATDHWQEHDGREDLGEVLEAAITHLGEAFRD